MAESRCRQAWRQTSAVMALLANLHRDPKRTRPFRPADFDPYEARKAKAVSEGDLGLLKQAFVNPRKGAKP